MLLRRSKLALSLNSRTVCSVTYRLLHRHGPSIHSASKNRGLTLNFLPFTKDFQYWRSRFRVCNIPHRKSVPFVFHIKALLPTWWGLSFFLTSHKTPYPLWSQSVGIDQLDGLLQNLYCRYQRETDLVNGWKSYRSHLSHFLSHLCRVKQLQTITKPTVKSESVYLTRYNEAKKYLKVAKTRSELQPTAKYFQTQTMNIFVANNFPQDSLWLNLEEITEQNFKSFRNDITSPSLQYQSLQKCQLHCCTGTKIYRRTKR